MTTAQIRYFLVAAEQLNFTAAAEQLYITQPSLSRQIAAIESELGARLFSRSNNVVSLTEAGTALYHRLTAFYQEYQSIVKEVRDISSGAKGHLNVGILEDQYMGPTLTHAIRQLLQDNDQCELNIVRQDSSTLFSSLQDGTIDIGLMLIYKELAQFGFSSFALDTAPARLAIARHHPAAARTRLTFQDLLDLMDDLPLVMAARDQFPEPLQQALTQFPPFDGLGSRRSQVKLLPAISSVPLYVTTGLGMTLSNRGSLLANDPNVVMLPVEGIPLMTQGLVWYKNGDNPLLTQLLALLRD